MRSISFIGLPSISVSGCGGSSFCVSNVTTSREILDWLFAEGAYTGGAGWNGVLATHAGRYLDCPATGKQIGVNGLDFWRREGDRITENWVFVDMLHLFRQFGVDLLVF